MLCEKVYCGVSLDIRGKPRIHKQEEVNILNKLYWVRESGEPEGSTFGYVEMIELSTGEIIRFDDVDDRIDLTPLRNHIGETIEHYRDGRLTFTRIIEDVSPDDERNGVMTLWMTDIPEKKDANAI